MGEHAAIFLDRDGVIVINKSDYVRSWEDVEFYPESLAALASLARSSYKIVIVTNQSVVGRGLIPLSVAEQINEKIQKTIEEAGGRIDAVFMCAHAPWDSCDCRKPKPGLLLQAAQQLSIDMTRSIMIGDALEDIQTGQAAGVSRTVLLLTGRGVSQLALANSNASLGYFDVCDSLSDAIRSLLGENSSEKH